MDRVRPVYGGPLAIACDPMVINVTKDDIVVRMATANEYVLPPNVTKAYIKAPRTDPKDPFKKVLSERWDGYTPPPVPECPYDTPKEGPASAVLFVCPLFELVAVLGVEAAELRAQMEAVPFRCAGVVSNRHEVVLEYRCCAINLHRLAAHVGRGGR